MKSDRLAELAVVKLRGLVSEHLSIESGDPKPFGAGASLRIGSSAWVYSSRAQRGYLGSAVAWATNADIDELNVIFDSAAEEFAFAAGGYSNPKPAVWRAAGRELVNVVGKTPTIEPAPPCDDLLAQLQEADLDVVADHGVWIGEINGLELARVGRRSGVCALDIGVGAYDQFASEALGDTDVQSRLIEVAAMVRPHRVAGSAPHPMGRLVRSRWLRAQAIRDPSTIGLETLEPTPLTIPRPGLSEAQPAAAIGSAAGEKVLVVFTVGLDLGVSETAAAMSRLVQPDRVLVVLPVRDRHPRIVESVGRVAPNAGVVTLDGEWSDTT